MHSYYMLYFISQVLGFVLGFLINILPAWLVKPDNQHIHYKQSSNNWTFRRPEIMNSYPQIFSFTPSWGLCCEFSDCMQSHQSSISLILVRVIVQSYLGNEPAHVPCVANVQSYSRIGEVGARMCTKPRYWACRERFGLERVGFGGKLWGTMAGTFKEGKASWWVNWA